MRGNRKFERKQKKNEDEATVFFRQLFLANETEFKIDKNRLLSKN
jgi:hypothetical protein